MLWGFIRRGKGVKLASSLEAYFSRMQCYLPRRLRLPHERKTSAPTGLYIL